jgi:hypothetical protein
MAGCFVSFGDRNGNAGFAQEVSLVGTWDGERERVAKVERLAPAAGRTSLGLKAAALDETVAGSDSRGFARKPLGKGQR